MLIVLKSEFSIPDSSKLLSTHPPVRSSRTAPLSGDCSVQTLENLNFISQTLSLVQAPSFLHSRREGDERSDAG
ncbi:hypothetical protein SAMN05428947_110129 [Mucilaginibacter sp. OK283]|nr:hypothetical protein SAMN05428947_110129 [Mucilaginibacter sp. OK283]